MQQWMHGHTHGWNSCGTKEGCFKRRFSKTWCSLTVKKICVGGIKEDIEECDLRDHFEQYGKNGSD